LQHDRFKVSIFLVFDVIVTLAMFYILHLTNFHIFAIFALAIQLYLLFSVFMYWQQLQAEHKKRTENLEFRKRFGETQGYVRDNSALGEVRAEPSDLKTSA
jgi:Ca2+/Na+ antiporter